MPAIACCLFVFAAMADQFNLSRGYCELSTGSGSVLKQQFHDLIDDHTVVSYGDARTRLPYADQDPGHPDATLLVYDRVLQTTPTG